MIKKNIGWALLLAFGLLAVSANCLAQERVTVSARLTRQGFTLTAPKNNFVVPPDKIARNFRVELGKHEGFSIYGLTPNGATVDYYKTYKYATDWNATAQKFMAKAVMEQPGPLGNLVLGPREYFLFPAGTEGDFVTISFDLVSSAPLKPTRLAIFAMPNPALLNGDEVIEIIVQLQDLNGDPAIMPPWPSSPFVVNLTSSEPKILKPYYPEGDARRFMMLNSNFGHTLFKPAGEGTAVITASAPDFESVSVSIQVFRATEAFWKGKQNAPARLKLFVLPPKTPAGTTPRMLAQVMNSQGRPTLLNRAQNITLISTDPTIIENGTYYDYNNFTYMNISCLIGGKPGTTTLSLSTQELTSDPVSFTAVAVATPNVLPTLTPPISEKLGTYTVGATLIRKDAYLGPEKNNFLIPPGKRAVNFRVVSGNHEGFSIYSLTPTGNQQDWYKTFKFGTDWNATAQKFMSTAIQEQPGPLGNLILGPGEYFLFPAGSEGASVMISYDLEAVTSVPGTPPLSINTGTVTASLVRKEAVLFPEIGKFVIPPGKKAVNFRVVSGNYEGFSIYSLTPTGNQQDWYKTFKFGTDWNATAQKFMSTAIQEQPGPLGNLILGPGEYFLFPAGSEGASVTITYDLLDSK